MEFIMETIPRQIGARSSRPEQSNVWIIWRSIAPCMSGIILFICTNIPDVISCMMSAIARQSSAGDVPGTTDGHSILFTSMDSNIAPPGIIAFTMVFMRSFIPAIIASWALSISSHA